MKHIKTKLLKQAKEQWGDNIQPCHNRTFDECFQVHGNKLILYFNVVGGECDRSTRCVAHHLETVNE